MRLRSVSKTPFSRKSRTRRVEKNGLQLLVWQSIFSGCWWSRAPKATRFSTVLCQNSRDVQRNDSIEFYKHENHERRDQKWCRGKESWWTSGRIRLGLLDLHCCNPKIVDRDAALWNRSRNIRHASNSRTMIRTPELHSLGMKMNRRENQEKHLQCRWQRLYADTWAYSYLTTRLVPGKRDETRSGFERKVSVTKQWVTHDQQHSANLVKQLLFMRKQNVWRDYHSLLDSRFQIKRRLSNHGEVKFAA